MRRAKRSYDGRALSVAVAISATLLAPPPPVFADNLDAMEERLGLADLVRQALKVNLDLAAQRDALEADREQVGIAR